MGFVLELAPPRQLIVAFILHLDGLLQNPNLRVKCVFELTFGPLRWVCAKSSGAKVWFSLVLNIYFRT